MIFLLSAAGLGLLALPGTMHRIGRRLHPREWTVLCTVALGAGTTLVVGTVVLIAAPPAFDTIGLRSLARACERMLGGLYPGGTTAWMIALAVMLSSVLFAGRALLHAARSASRARAGARLGTPAGRHGCFEVIVVPDDRSYALSVPDRHGSGQVLVSRGVLGTLGPAELEVVCAHEAAHLRLGHRRYVVLAHLIEEAFWWWPPARRSTQVLRLAVERWADEVAAGRRPESRTRLRTALMVVAGVGPLPALAAFSAVDGLVERLGALESLPRRAHIGWWVLLAAPGMMIGVLALFAGNRLGHQAYCALAMPGHCRSR